MPAVGAVSGTVGHAGPHDRFVGLLQKESYRVLLRPACAGAGEHPAKGRMTIS
jgi:hypothetical protein